MELIENKVFPPLNGDHSIPVDTVSLESGDTETCLLVERSPGHQGPLAHPAPKKHHSLIMISDINRTPINQLPSKLIRVYDNGEPAL